MVRISRHSSHRSHKHRDRSVSDDEDISKERKQKLEEEDSTRISRPSDQENRSCSSKYLVSSCKDAMISDHGKRRKGTGDRCNGAGDEDARVEKEAKGENSETEFEKRSKGKSSSSFNKKRGDMSEKNDEKRVGKERSRKESSSSLYKYSKEKEKQREKDKASEKDKEKKECSTKHEIEVSEEVGNPVQIKEIGKRYKRRDEYGENKKVSDSKDGHPSRSYKDGRYKEKCRDEHDREYKHCDNKRRRDEHSSRMQNEMSDSPNKKIKLQCSDNGGSCYSDDHISKHRGSKRRKRPSEEIGDQNEMKNRNAKKPCDDTVKCGFSSSKYDLSPDRVKMDHSYVEKADSSSCNIRLEISPNIDYPAKDQNWDKSRETEDNHRSPSVVRERISEFKPSEIAKQKDTVSSNTSVSESDLTPQSDSLTSPNHLSEKAPYTNEILHAEHGQNSNNAAISNTSNNAPLSMPVNKARNPSALGSYEEEIRNQNNRKRRGGPGTPWKSSGANCFMPIQHGPPLGFPHPAVPQFHSNVGPTPYNNVNMHPYSMQMWDGNPNMFREEPQVYGRQEWDQSRHLTGNRVRNAGNDNVWNGQNGNMYLNHNFAQKEMKYSHDRRVKLEKQVDGGSTPAKTEISDPSKSLADKTSETKIDSSASYVHYYLSKLDISPDLARPDVYEQCLFFMEGRDVKSTSHSSGMGQRKNNLNSFRPVAKCRQSLLTHPVNTIFQRAICLFNKQMEGSKFCRKVEDFMDKVDKNNDEEAADATSQANVQGVDHILKADEHYEGKAKTQVNAADLSSDIVVCVEVSEKNDNVGNLESVGVNISPVQLSAESTH